MGEGEVEAKGRGSDRRQRSEVRIVKSEVQTRRRREFAVTSLQVAVNDQSPTTKNHEPGTKCEERSRLRTNGRCQKLEQ